MSFFVNFERILQIAPGFIFLADFEQVNNGGVGFEKHKSYSFGEHCTTNKGFFSKCENLFSYRQLWLHLLKSN